MCGSAIMGAENSPEAEDELIDLNKLPVERKRKKLENSVVDDGGCDRAEGLVNQGRVLRSRTVAMSDGEKQVIKMEIVSMGDKRANKVSRLEDKDEEEADPQKETVIVRKRGRPRKVECKPESGTEASPLVHTLKRKRGRPPKVKYETEIVPKPTQKKRKKNKRGRPPKSESINEASNLNAPVKLQRGRPRKKGGIVVLSCEEVDGNSNGNCDGSGKLSPQIKPKRGRPPKKEDKNVVSVLSCEDGAMGHGETNVKNNSICDGGMLSAPIKVYRGRPSKKEDEVFVSVLGFEEHVGKVEADGKNNGICKGRGKLKRKRKLGRPPKALQENVGKKDGAKRNRGSEKAGRKKKSKRILESSQDGIMTREMGKGKSSIQTNVRRNEQKQLLRDSILAMLTSAGWSVEYRQRQFKEYHDAVYVDHEGRGYWSITLAYRKFKERIDKGIANEKDISAFVPIPEETLSLLYRADSRANKNVNVKKKSGCAIGKQRTLLARRPKDGSDGDGFELYDGKLSLLSWMIDNGTAPLRGKVKYMTMRGRWKKILREGTIEKEGIRCDCCNIMHTIRGFESHAGSMHGKPYENIYLDSGNSLSQCLVDSWKKHVEADDIGFAYVDVDGDDPNDDTCNVCGDGGDLICCDSCPSTFHHGCLHIDVPSGDWQCVYCSCKFCGTAEETSDQNKIVRCHMCDEKFHVECTNEMTTEEGNLSFCGKACYKIFQQLKDLLGLRNELEEGFSYTVLQFRNFSSKVPLDSDISSLENNSKLAVAFTVMDECFQPITDERSGSSVIHNVVYSCGSNIRRLNFEKFFTIILEKGEEFVSAASIRIHGSSLAEMPFIGTRYTYRRQGMCSRLLNAVEKVLNLLGVEKLVIPAISELNDTWTKVFGFIPLEEPQRHQMKYMNLIAFPRVDMLQKTIQPQQSTPENWNLPTKCSSNSDGHHDIQVAEAPCPIEAPPHTEMVLPTNSVAAMDDESQCGAVSPVVADAPIPIHSCLNQPDLPLHHGGSRVIL